MAPSDPDEPASRELSAAEKRLRVAVAAASLGVFEWHVSSDAAIWDNERMYKIFGRTNAQGPLTLAEFTEDVIEPEDRATFERTFATAMTPGSELHATCRIRRQHDGELRWIEISGRFEGPAQDAATRLIGVVADVTERRQMSDALREVRERSELVWVGGGAAVWDWDVAHHKVAFSSRWKAIRGFADDEIGDSEEEWSSRIHADDLDRVMAAIEAHFAGETPFFSEEYRVRRKDGSWMWVADRGLARRDANGRVVRMAGSEIDITDRKRAEDDLARQTELLQQLFDNIPILLVVWDPRLERFTLNRFAEDVLGWTTADANEHDLMKLAYPDPTYREEAATFMQSLSLGWREWMVATKQGERIPVEWTNIRLTDATMIGIGVDLRERKAAETALRESEEKFRSALSNAAIGFAMTTPGGVFVDANPAYCRLTGYDIDELRTLTFPRLIHPDDVDENLQLIDRMLAGEFEDFVVENRYDRKDGTSAWVRKSISLVRNDEGAPQWIIALVEDVTNRRMAERALRESEAFYRQMLESIPGMVFTTRPDGYCDYQSQQWVDYTGVPMDEHLGDGWNRLLHPDDRPRAMTAWMDAVHERAPYDLEYRVRRHDGVYEWFKVIGRPIRDGADGIVRWFGVALNIQDLKQTDEELQVSLREKEVLLQEVHHRVKNNLQVVSSLVNLQAEAVTDPALRAALQDVCDRVRTMALVHQGLYQSGNLAEVAFATYAAELLRNLWRAHDAASAAIRLNLELEPVGLFVETAVPCGLILSELASNALKHAFAGRERGEVTVELKSIGTRGVQLTVRDDGVGLPTHVDPQDAPTLGLQLVQRLARQIDATVTVARGGGTMITVAFTRPEPGDASG